jgi:hypothetical protein
MAGLIRKKECLFCGKEFITRRLRQKYCSSECRCQHFHETHLLISQEQYEEYEKLKQACPHA